ncbi:MAG: HD domain-containing protein [Nitrospirae bacterium]|nr:HD domain-containing protein [Nitrospirota bacterium]
MFPPYLFAYAETLRAEPAVAALRAIAGRMGARLWLTGGTLRDVLLTRWPKDLDLAVDGDTTELGQRLEAAGHGRCVPLDPDTGTVRLALRGSQGIDWIDMVTLRAATIEGDLAARDFSVNAIALPLDDAFDTATAAFVDPTGGRADLHARVLRLAGPTALADDPARIARGYRLAAQLGFSLDPETRSALRAHAALVARPAVERIARELDELLAAPDPSTALADMMADGVLPVLLPELAAGVGATQNGYHHLDVWGHTLQTVAELARLLRDPLARPEDTELDACLRDDETRRVLAWAALLHDVGKPATRHEEHGRVRFIGHEREGARLTEAVTRRLRLSGRRARRVARLVAHHLRPMLLMAQGTDTVTVRAIDRLCRDLEEDLEGLFLLALADTRAARGPDRPADAEQRLLALWNHVRTVRHRHIRPVDDGPPFLTGDDLVRRFGVPQGPLVGELLRALRDARLAGEITTRQDVKHWLRARLKGTSGGADKDS